MLINIHDKYLKKVAFIDNDKPGALHFYNDVWHRYLKEATSTFDFTIPKTGHSSVGFLNEKGYVSFNIDGRAYLFNIMRTEETERELTCYCENLNLELLNEQAAAYTAPRAMSFEEYFNNETQIGGIYYSDLVIGVNEVADYRRSLKWESTETKLARLLSLVNNFDAECEFVTELNRDGTLKHIVLNVYKKHDDDHQGVGKRRLDVTLYYGKQVDSIRRTVDKTELYSAIYPVGKDGLTISSLNKVELDKDGRELYFSRSGQPYIYAPQTAEEYPAQLFEGKDSWILYRWDYDTDNVNTLYGQGLAKLKEISQPALTYEVEGDLMLDIGDTVKIYDDKFTPTLILEARVAEQEVSFCDPSKNKNVFCNFRSLENKISESITSRLDSIVAEAMPYRIEILSSDGTAFKNGEGQTTLTARVLKGANNVTGSLQIEWLKSGEQSPTTGTSLTVLAKDIQGNISVKAVAKKDGTEVASEELTLINISIGGTNMIKDSGVAKEETTVSYYATSMINSDETCICTIHGEPASIDGFKVTVGGTTNTAKKTLKGSFVSELKLSEAISPGDVLMVENVAKIDKIKLERGSVSTDWTPAPEDVDAEIDKAQSDSAAANHNSVQAQEAAKDAANTADQANKLANSNKAWLQDWSFSGEATIDGGKIQAKTVTAEQLNVKELAALSADLGVVTAGVIQSADGNLKLDLNSSDGLRIKSVNKSTELIADGAGTRVVDSAGNKVAEFTSSGTETKQIKVSGKSELSGILIEPVGDEIWISRVI